MRAGEHRFFLCFRNKSVTSCEPVSSGKRRVLSSGRAAGSGPAPPGAGGRRGRRGCRLKTVHPCGLQAGAAGTPGPHPHPSAGRQRPCAVSRCHPPVPSPHGASHRPAHSGRLCGPASVLSFHFRGPLKSFTCSRKSYFFIHCFHHLLVSFLKKKFFLV